MGDNGLDAVRATLERMRKLVKQYKTDPNVIGCARKILIDNGIYDVRRQKWESICFLQGWVRDSIAYVPDPRDVEMIQTPDRTLQWGTGDCDDKAILLATFLETCNFASRFIAVGGHGGGWGDEDDEPDDPTQPPPFSHVLTQVRFGADWLCLETIVPDAVPGWCPPGICIFMVRHI